ncbi:MAG: phosphate ABC transporter permease PstA [Armatimonadota bacterium]
MVKPRRALAEPLTALAAWGAAAVVCLVFLWLAAEVARAGVGRLSLPFLIAPEEDAGRSGGIGPILVSTGLILAVSMGASVVIGLPAAVLLAELSGAGRFGAAVRRSLDLLAGMPSIVFGLFGNAFFCGALGLRFSILSGGLTLACMVLPLLIRTSEEALRGVPAAYREAAAALALSRTTLLFRVLLPAALPGLLVGLVLGTGRALAETAALVFTSGYVTRMPGSLLDSGRALSVHIYDLSMNVAGGDASAGASALVLMVLILALNGATEWLAGRWRRSGEARP